MKHTLKQTQQLSTLCCSLVIFVLSLKSHLAIDGASALTTPCEIKT